MTPVDLRGKTIVVTGATGQVAEPVAMALAATNQVVAGARFRDAGARARLESAGVRCVPIDLLSGDVAGLPADADYVVNFAVAKSNEWENDLRANSGGLAYLMEHHRDAKAFLHCSTTGIYKPMGHHVFAENDPLGDNHGVWPFLRTYSISKIAAESTALWAADRFGLPTTIARLSVPYGDRGGWPAIHLEMMINGGDIPVHVDAPSTYHPIHEDDIIAMVREPGGEHRGVVRLSGRTHRARAKLRPDCRDDRQRGDRPDPDAQARRTHQGGMAGRDAAHGAVPASRAAPGLTGDGPGPLAAPDRALPHLVAHRSDGFGHRPGGVAHRPGAASSRARHHQALALHEHQVQSASRGSPKPACRSGIGGQKWPESLGSTRVEVMAFTVHLELEGVGNHDVRAAELQRHPFTDEQAEQDRILKYQLEPPRAALGIGGPVAPLHGRIQRRPMHPGLLRGSPRCPDQCLGQSSETSRDIRRSSSAAAAS
jgi:UDP-glucuronate 4-epimerase